MEFKNQENQKNQSFQQIFARIDHCIHCFEVLISALNKKNDPQFPLHLENHECPLFVTWKTKNDELRGCIGTYSSKNLNKQLTEYAKISAFQDSRFNPIQQHELTHLSVSVSLLINFESGKHVYDWDIGTHGIYIEFLIDDYSYNGTFLPEVAQENNWNKDYTLQQLIKKAGKFNLILQQFII